MFEIKIPTSGETEVAGGLGRADLTGYSASALLGIDPPQLPRLLEKARAAIEQACFRRGTHSSKLFADRSAVLELINHVDTGPSAAFLEQLAVSPEGGVARLEAAFYNSLDRITDHHNARELLNYSDRNRLPLPDKLVIENARARVRALYLAHVKQFEQDVDDPVPEAQRTASDELAPFMEPAADQLRKRTIAEASAGLAYLNAPDEAEAYFVRRYYDYQKLAPAVVLRNMYAEFGEDPVQELLCANYTLRQLIRSKSPAFVGIAQGHLLLEGVHWQDRSLVMPYLVGSWFADYPATEWLSKKFILPASLSVEIDRTDLTKLDFERELTLLLGSRALVPDNLESVVDPQWRPHFEAAMSRVAPLRYLVGHEPFELTRKFIEEFAFLLMNDNRPPRIDLEEQACEQADRVTAEYERIRSDNTKRLMSFELGENGSYHLTHGQYKDESFTVLGVLEGKRVDGPGQQVAFGRASSFLFHFTGGVLTCDGLFGPEALALVADHLSFDIPAVENLAGDTVYYVIGREPEGGGIKVIGELVRSVWDTGGIR